MSIFTIYEKKIAMHLPPNPDKYRIVPEGMFFSIYKKPSEIFPDGFLCTG
jgi:hypothetical protein